MSSKLGEPSSRPTRRIDRRRLIGKVAVTGATVVAWLLPIGPMERLRLRAQPYCGMTITCPDGNPAACNFVDCVFTCECCVNEQHLWDGYFVKQIHCILYCTDPVIFVTYPIDCSYVDNFQPCDTCNADVSGSDCSSRFIATC